jgi:CBS domain-containing protein
MKLNQLDLRQAPAVGLEQGIDKALEIMSEYQVDLLPVVEGGRLVGSIDLRDMAREYIAGREAAVGSAAIGATCNRHPLLCQGDTSLRTALETMLEYNVTNLLVAEANGEAYGLVTSQELIKRLLDNLPIDSEVPEMASVRRVRGGEKAL